MTLIRPNPARSPYHHARHRCSIEVHHGSNQGYQKVWLKRADRSSWESLVAHEDREPYYDFMVSSSSSDYVYVDRSYDAVGDELDGIYQLVRFDLRHDPPQEEVICEDLLHLVPDVWRTIVHGIVDVVDDRELYLVAILDAEPDPDVDCEVGLPRHLIRWSIESGAVEVLEELGWTWSFEDPDPEQVASEDRARLVLRAQYTSESFLSSACHQPTRHCVSQLRLGERAALLMARMSEDLYLSLGRFDDEAVSYESFCLDQSCEVMYALALSGERIALVSFELRDRVNAERVLHADLRELRLDGEPVGVRRLIGAQDDRDLYLEAWLDPEHTKLAWLKLELSTWVLSLHTLTTEESAPPRL